MLLQPSNCPVENQSGRKKRKEKKMRGVNSLRLHANTPGVELDLGIWPVSRKVNLELTKDPYLFFRAGEFLSSYPGL